MLTCFGLLWLDSVSGARLGVNRGPGGVGPGGHAARTARQGDPVAAKVDGYLWRLVRLSVVFYKLGRFIRRVLVL